MQHHVQVDNLIGSIFSIASLLFWWLGKMNINIEDVAAFLAVMSGSASLIINYPKLKKRAREIIQKLKSK